MCRRLDHGRKRLHPLPGSADELPDGAVVAAAGQAYTLAYGRAFRWTARGYEYTLMWGLLCFAIALRGGGPYSVDRRIGVEL